MSFVLATSRACGVLILSNRLTEANGGRKARGGIARVAQHVLGTGQVTTRNLEFRRSIEAQPRASRPHCYAHFWPKAIVIVA